MNIVKAWQSKTNEPKNVPSTITHRGNIYEYSSTQYIAAGNRNKTDCMKGVRMDIYRSETALKPAVVLSLLNNIRGYMMINTKEYLLDINGDGKFGSISKWSVDTCFTDWNMEKYFDILDK